MPSTQTWITGIIGLLAVGLLADDIRTRMENDALTQKLADAQSTIKTLESEVDAASRNSKRPRAQNRPLRNGPRFNAPPREQALSGAQIAKSDRDGANQGRDDNDDEAFEDRIEDEVSARMAERREARMERRREVTRDAIASYAEQNDLTEAEEEELVRIFDETGDRMRALWSSRDDPDFDRAAARDELRNLREENEVVLIDMLGEDGAAALRDEMRASFRSAR